MSADLTPSEFLITLWGKEPPGWALVWTMPDKLSTWTRWPERIDQFVASASDKDVYTGVSLAPNTPEILKRHQRITNAQASAIAGLWADIDLRNDAHKKTNLPESESEAMEILKGVNYKPSIVVHSGHGLQCWWLFARPWVFQDAHERLLAQQLTCNWHGLIADQFMYYGYTVDATHDLARVMRLPGTWNHKEPIKQPVKVIQTSDFRWRDLPTLKRRSKHHNLTSFAHTDDSPAEVGSLILNPERRLSGNKLAILQALRENIQKFADTWNENRSDFKDGDNSASVYDYSIAYWCSEAGFSPQEVADAIIEWRREHGHDLAKAMRLDYMQRTIRKVRNGTTGTQR